MADSPLPVRWRKVTRDLVAERGRVALMTAAIAISVIGVGTMLGAYAILTREMSRSYLGTQPASATLELEGDARAAVPLALAYPNVEAAEVELGVGACDHVSTLLEFRGPCPGAVEEDRTAAM